MVEISESYLLFAAGAVFIPLFGFLIKMIIEQASNKNKIVEFEKHLDDAKEITKKVSDMDWQIKVLEQKLQELDQDLKEFFRKSNTV